MDLRFKSLIYIQSINQTITIKITKPIYILEHQSINQSINQTITIKITKPIYILELQSINQSINYLSIIE